MLENEGVALKAIRWSEIFPWLAIGKSFRLAVSPRLLVFGAAALLLTLAGWYAIAKAFEHGNARSTPVGAPAFGNDTVWDIIDGGVPDRPPTIGRGWFAAYRPLAQSHGRPRQAIRPTRERGIRLAGPSCNCFPLPRPRPIERRQSIFWRCFSRACGRWRSGPTLARPSAGRRPWNWPLGNGSAGARCSAGSAASGRPIRRPLVPMLGVAIAAVPVVVLGLLTKVGFFAAVGGLIWPLPLAGCWS